MVFSAGVEEIVAGHGWSCMASCQSTTCDGCVEVLVVAGCATLEAVWYSFECEGF